MDLKNSCLAIILLPLIASGIAGLFGKKIKTQGAHTVTVLAVGFSFFLSLFVLYTVVFGTSKSIEIAVYNWGESGGVRFQIGFLIDRLSALMMTVVTFVSWMVHIYTIGYMRGDPGYQRFFSYISLFTFGMLTLVMSNNFLQLFFGWEMVGLMSYLLIGFWFQRESAIQANLKAFIVNRVGDFGFIVGISAVFYYFGTLDYSVVFERASSLRNGGLMVPLSSTVSLQPLTFICFCLFLGAMGKSAQIPLHVWLPDSMEGPTPISALIHAATMVTAGVFMIARLSPLFEYSEAVLNIILFIGSITCLLMGLVAIVQNDIKRIIAYSTLSQLGIMMAAMGVSAYPIGIFHLVTHAFFKSLLFLGAGSVIIALHHEQDIWKMGNLRKFMPITYAMMLIGSLAIVGFPFFSGFYSKDLIIEAVKFSNLPFSSAAYVILVGSVFITALYTFRLFFVVFHTEARMDKTIRAHLQESPAVIWAPLVLLALPSLVAGALLVEPLLEGFLKGAIIIHPNHLSFPLVQEEFKGVFAMGMNSITSPVFWMGVAGIFVAFVSYIYHPNIPVECQKKFRVVYQVLKAKYGFDELNQRILVFVRSMGSFFWRFGDQWFIDSMGVNGSADSIGRLSLLVRKIQTGYLYHYAFVMIAGFLCILFYLIL